MSEKMDSNTKEIYIKLLEEGTDVWRPTLGRNLGNELFEVLAAPDYDPEDEIWEFLPGSIVKTEKRKSADGEYYCAIKP